jgi:hypothetical protein
MENCGPFDGLDLLGLPNVGKGVLDATLHTQHISWVSQRAFLRLWAKVITYVATSVSAFDQLHLALGVQLERVVVELALLQELSVMVGALIPHSMRDTRHAMITTTHVPHTHDTRKHLDTLFTEEEEESE